MGRSNARNSARRKSPKEEATPRSAAAVADRAGFETESEPPSPPISARDAAALGLFFLSGAAGLMYEVSWSRQIGLLFGHTVHSAAVVLTCYFAGMAIGYLLAARWVGRVVPLVGYGVAELAVAAWAPLVPLLLAGIEGSPLAGWLVHPSPGVQVAIRAALAFGLLLPAAVGLGASLPFMAEHLSPRGRLATGRVALAYALNTTGALVGVALTTAVLMLALGVRGSGMLAAALSGFCGLAAILLARWARDGAREGAEERPAPGPIRWRSSGLWVGLAALSGFGTLALQVMYTRMFSLTFHNSTYTFGAVLTVFLAGLALGSAGVSRLHRRFPPEKLLGAAGGLGAAAVLLSVVVFVRATGLEYFKVGESFASYIVGVFGLVALVVLPPVALLGALLPTIWKAAAASNAGEPGGGVEGGAVVGWLTAGNALAASLGALLASFVMLPALGLWPSIVACAMVFGLVPAVLLVRRGMALEAAGLAAVLLGLGLYAGGVPGKIRTLPPDPSIAIIASWEGPYGLLEVVEVRPGYRVLRQNLHYGLGSTGLSTPRELRQGHLPLLLHPEPSEVLFLGLGTGLTSGAATIHPAVDRIEIAELIPEVVEAARYFEPENLGVVDHPKVTIRVDDARHDMLGSRKRYDVIISDLFVPWESRAGYLYTVEHFELARSRLNDGGLFCLWLPVYQLGVDELRIIGDSFASVFPEASAWWGQLSDETAMLALIGSERPITIDADRVESALPAIRETLDDPDLYLDSPETLARLYVGDWPAPGPGATLNTDEHPRVEFFAPIRHGGSQLLTGDRLLKAFDQLLRALPARDVLPEASVDEDDGRLRTYRHRVWQRERLGRPVGAPDPG